MNIINTLNNSLSSRFLIMNRLNRNIVPLTFNLINQQQQQQHNYSKSKNTTDFVEFNSKKSKPSSINIPSVINSSNLKNFDVTKLDSILNSLNEISIKSSPKNGTKNDEIDNVGVELSGPIKTNEIKRIILDFKKDEMVQALAKDQNIDGNYKNFLEFLNYHFIYYFNLNSIHLN
jgi:hypothetical protein